jgi:hypothetical protein
MRLVAGRWMTDDDIENAPLVVVVNDGLARRFFPNGDALGKRLYLKIPRARSGARSSASRPITRPAHSDRNASEGSTQLARRAGIQHASMATASSTPTTMP